MIRIATSTNKRVLDEKSVKTPYKALVPTRLEPRKKRETDLVGFLQSDLVAVLDQT